MNQKIKKDLLNVILLAGTAAVAVFIGSNLPQLIGQWRGPIRSGDFAVHVEKMPHQITLYGTSTCPHCQTARTYLRDAGIAFNDLIVDQSKSAEASFKQLEQKGVPVLVSSHKMVVGFDAKAYTEVVNTLHK
jgi:glutaredoxin